MREWNLAVVLFLAAAGEFAKYPAQSPLRGTPASPRLATDRARRFQTHLRNAAAEGPNFNGHYKVTHFGGGSSLIEWVVIDLTDGTVWIAPEPAVACFAPGESTNAAGLGWYEVHLDSALLYLHECRAGALATHAFDTRLVYVWERGKAQLLRTEKLPK